MLLLASDEDDDDPEIITDPMEVAHLFCAIAETAAEMGFDADELKALVDAVIERVGKELN